jgi:hypothetical protein
MCVIGGLCVCVCVCVTMPSCGGCAVRGVPGEASCSPCVCTSNTHTHTHTQGAALESGACPKLTNLALDDTDMCVGSPCMMRTPACALTHACMFTDMCVGSTCMMHTHACTLTRACMSEVWMCCPCMTPTHACTLTHACMFTDMCVGSTCMYTHTRMHVGGVDVLPMHDAYTCMYTHTRMHVGGVDMLRAASDVCSALQGRRRP